MINLPKLSLDANEWIIQDGDKSDNAYWIEKGVVDIVLTRKKQTQKLATFSDGEVFGEISIFLNSPRTAGAISVTPTTLYVLERDNILKAYENSGGIYQIFLKSLFTYLIQH